MKNILFLLIFLIPLSGFATTNDVWEVVAEGVGYSEREAVTDAFRNSIEEVVGLYVDSETKFENDKLISDKILTASKAYIHKYRITSVSNKNGLTQVTIKALVKMQDVKASLSGLNVSILSANDMENTHARMASKLIRSKDAEKILMKTFSDFFSDSNIMELLNVELKGYRIFENEVNQDNTVPFEVSFQISFNLENYNTRIKELATVFDNLGGVVNKTFPVILNPSTHSYAEITSPDFRSYYKSVGGNRGVRPEDKACFGLISYTNPNYQMDHYCFPSDWKTIYPWNQEWNNLNSGKKGPYILLNNLNVIVQFQGETGIVLEKRPAFRRYDELKKDVLQVLKVGFGQSGSNNRLGMRWGGWNIAASGFNIGPFFNYEVSSVVNIKYRDVIDVDLLYDIQRVEVKIEMEEK
jgi:hypothetical protein